MKNVCVITSSRADYGLLFWVLKNLKNSKKIKLKIIVSGMHFAKKHGLTYKEILKDNFEIDSKVYFKTESNNSKDLISSFSNALTSYNKSFKKLNINYLVILGDRYEIFSAILPACYANIPIAHIHGGERTEGAIDESIRHAITKFSQLHFVSHLL